MEDEDIIDLTPDELKAYISSHHESSFRLIDVREPSEYSEGHMPGSVLLPLSDADSLIKNLREETADILFCCNAGNRSLVAALFLAESFPKTSRIYHLAGGIHAWNGLVVPDIPRTDLFPGNSPMASLIRTAINMEKGAYNFYKSAMAMPVAGTSFKKTMGKLMGDERRHARVLFDSLPDKSKTGESFNDLFRKLDGEFIEGGKNLDIILKKLAGIQEYREYHLLDTALILEYSAYDLYKAMACLSEKEEIAAMFSEVAQAEKAHITLIAETMGTISGPKE